MQIILASSSPARKEILTRLKIPFIAISPDIDETPTPGETPIELVQRLAKEKALAIAANCQEPAIIIGSDQVAMINDQIVGKPHTHENAITQLQAASGQCVTFYCGMSVHLTPSNHTDVILEKTDVYFRELTLKEIELYLHQEQPYQCAGGFKSEGRGALLTEKIVGTDPNCLIGLPAIALQGLLLEQGVNLLEYVS